MVELGAGVGLLGLYLAHLGAQVQLCCAVYLAGTMGVFLTAPTERSCDGGTITLAHLLKQPLFSCGILSMTFVAHGCIHTLVLQTWALSLTNAVFYTPLCPAVSQTLEAAA